MSFIISQTIGYSSSLCGTHIVLGYEFSRSGWVYTQAHTRVPYNTVSF